VKVLIVGHGNSTVGRNLGEYIDSFDGYVVRFPSTNWQSIEDYGWKTDYVSATVDRRRRIPYDDRQPTIGVWIYPFFHVHNKRGRHIADTLPVECPVIVCYEEIFPWLDRYKELQDEISDAPFLSSSIVGDDVTDDHKYSHFSNGTAAVIIAAQRILGIEEILLLGCDNLWEGTRRDFGRCNFRKTAPTAHNFKVEKALLDEVAREYGVDIRPL